MHGCVKSTSTEPFLLFFSYNAMTHKIFVFVINTLAFKSCLYAWSAYVTRVIAIVLKNFERNTM